MLYIDQLSIDRLTKPVLKNISIEIKKGELVGVIGPNGAGKSTLLEAMAGLIIPGAGRILLGEAQDNVHDLPYSVRAKHIAYLPQERALAWDMTVEQVVHLGRFAYGLGPLKGANEDAVNQALAKVGLSEFRTRQMNMLSGGEAARVHLARLLAGQALVNLVDEPINALDPHQQFQVMTILQEECQKGAMVIAAIHDLPLVARYCDRVIVLHQGELVANGASTEVLQAGFLKSIFNIDAQWIENDEGHHLLISDG